MIYLSWSSAGHNNIPSTINLQDKSKYVVELRIDWYLVWLGVVSFTNPLAAGSGLVERTPKKVRFSL